MHFAFKTVLAVTLSMLGQLSTAAPAYTYRVTIPGINAAPSTPPGASAPVLEPPVVPADPYAADVLSEIAFENGFSDMQGHTYAAGNGVSLSSNAKNGASAIALSGSGALSAVIPELNIGTSNLTFEAWINPTTTDHAGIFTTAPGFGGQLTVRLYAGHLNVFTGSAGAGDAYIVGAADIPTGVWTHVAAIRDGTTFRTYVNGRLDGQQTQVTTALTASTAYIGTERSHNFRGLIDDVRYTKNAVRYP